MFQRFENELENLLKSIKETLVTNSKSVRKLKVPTKVPLKSRPAHTIHTAMPARSSGAQPPRDASSVSLRVKGKTELTLEIVNGDITEETTDAIVSPTDEKLDFTGNLRQFSSRQPRSAPRKPSQVHDMIVSLHVHCPTSWGVELTNYVFFVLYI